LGEIFYFNPVTKELKTSWSDEERQAYDEANRLRWIKEVQEAKDLKIAQEGIKFP